MPSILLFTLHQSKGANNHTQTTGLNYLTCKQKALMPTYSKQTTDISPSTCLPRYELLRW